MPPTMTPISGSTVSTPLRKPRLNAAGRSSSQHVMPITTPLRIDWPMTTRR